MSTHRELLRPTVDNYGLYAEHDMPCAVSWEAPKSAVFDCNKGVFQPSWEAQQNGWRLVCANTWLRRLALRYIFGDTDHEG